MCSFRLVVFCLVWYVLETLGLKGTLWEHLEGTGSCRGSWRVQKLRCFHFWFFFVTCWSRCEYVRWETWWCFVSCCCCVLYAPKLEKVAAKTRKKQWRHAKSIVAPLMGFVATLSTVVSSIWALCSRFWFVFSFAYNDRNGAISWSTFLELSPQLKWRAARKHSSVSSIWAFVFSFPVSFFFLVCKGTESQLLGALQRSQKENDALDWRRDTSTVCRNFWAFLFVFGFVFLFGPQRQSPCGEEQLLGVILKGKDAWRAKLSHTVVSIILSSCWVFPFCFPLLPTTTESQLRAKWSSYSGAISRSREEKMPSLRTAHKHRSVFFLSFCSFRLFFSLAYNDRVAASWSNNPARERTRRRGSLQAQ